MSSRQNSAISRSACIALLLLGCSVSAFAEAGLPGDLVLDNADSITGWSTGSGNTRSLDAQIKVIGSGSLKSVGTARDRFRKQFTAVDVTKYRYLTFWYYVDRPDLLSTTTDLGQVEITSAATFDVAEWSWSVRELHLQRGWNYVVLDLPGRNTGSTLINPQQVNYFRIYHRPAVSITTRIDQIVFTNRQPRSSAFAAFLEQKRIAASPTAVAQEDDILQFLDRTRAGSAERARNCRQMTIDVTHWEISAETLQNLGVNFLTTRGVTTQKRWIRDVMCGTRAFPDRDTLVSRLQQLAQTEIAVVGEIATLYDLPMDAAAQTEDRLLQFDLGRILSACSSRPVEVDNYIRTGTVQSVFPGANVLVQQCTGTNIQIAGQLQGQVPAINDRGAAYKQCMSFFEVQGAECDNAYVNADDNFDKALKATHLRPAEQETAKQQMQQWLDEIAGITVQDARATTGETHGDSTHPRAGEIEDLHEKFDQLSAQIQYTEEVIQHTKGHMAAPITASIDQATAYTERQNAFVERLQAELTQYQDEQEEVVKRLCFDDKEDPQCPSGTAVEVQQPPATPPETNMSQRCASMDIAGQDSWFDKPVGRSGLAGQINESDRIDHCLCELFDRNYSSKLPGDTTLQVSNCPTPEERIAQKCLENPYDGIDGVRKECLHLMQPISTDRESLGARLCSKINPGCNAPYLKDDGGCGCGTRQPDGTIRPPGVSVGFPNCDAVGGMPTVGGGCQPFTSGANGCTFGGKDFYLTKDPVNDLKVRTFANKIPGQVFLIPKTGTTRMVTPGIRRSQLFNSTQLMVRALRLNPSDDGTGQVKVYCKNSTTLSAASRLLETINLSNISTTTPTFMTINLDSAEVTACYRNNSASRAYFEFQVETKTNQPLAFFDILGELGNIKPVCVQTPRPNSPTPGPRPLNVWPATYTFSDNTVITPKFLGVGPMPTPSLNPPPPTLPPLCVVDGVVVPCR